ncbi:cell division protein FtsX [Aliiroseovarius crassostreae]|uniref:Cell division protein FtsX n=1 Tax=Aliiroseovarius crassostreae TaxID=154981 RepID=A0A9Q9H8Z7_9RHOB|nr:FtsX-like permease family protein [Aliiroseovarius crassostreae]UWP88634.1 cell division protein FtsX [Aliiroseovarius crassostreae]UWP94941.1 cell division protein FtsX [Aliiroseovarius crassostreae]UWQ01287.1 cell division protein FtsX [Aliiroseovarius crassostreae]
MSVRVRQLLHLVSGDAQADRVVPPTGFTARLTVFAAGAMAFLAVFALALSLASGRLADRWAQALAKSATIRISAPADQIDIQILAVMEVLATTEGVKEARPLGDDEQRKLLEPWFGPDLPLERLPIPRLIEVIEDDTGVDVEGLRARLAGEAPGAVFDDHNRWREPLVKAAGRLRLLGYAAMGLITALAGVVITLAASAALSANEQVIRVLRLVGAQDAYIARAFVRRYTLRAFMGALGGTAIGMIAILLLPSGVDQGSFLTGLGFQGGHWLLPLGIPPVAAFVAFIATRQAALATLQEKR